MYSLKNLPLLTGIVFALGITLANAKPNVLWIIADDYSPDAGCYGDPLVQTPHLDALAVEGRQYLNAFATNPVCSPSRSAIFTGMYQTTIGAHQHRTFNTPLLPPDIKTVTEYFEAAGYYTCNGMAGQTPYVEGKTDFNFATDYTIFDGADWSGRAEGQPFFAAVQISEPHRPFVADLESPVDPELVQLPPYYPNHPVVRKDWANYLESVQVMDQRLGAILQRLEDEGLTENTIVFFFADQGRPMVRGKQWLYDSGLRVPLVVRWPGRIEPDTLSYELISLIDIAPTSLDAAGIQIPETMQGRNFLDANTPPREFIFAGRNRTDAVVDYIRCVRNKRFKYIRNYMPERPYNQFGHYKTFFYPTLTVLNILHDEGKLSPVEVLFMADSKPLEELYDTRVDPYEVHNLASDPLYRAHLGELRSALDAWSVETKDVGAFDPDNPDELQLRRWEKYGALWQERGIEDPRNIDWNSYLEFWKKELGLDIDKNP